MASADGTLSAAELAFAHALGTLRELQVLEKEHGPLETWWAKRRREQIIAAGVKPRRASTLMRRTLDQQAESSARWMESASYRGMRVPPGRWAGADPPAFLFLGGRIPDEEEPAVAMVGARRASGYGLRMGRRFGLELATSGVHVVSGLARGIDRVAHEGALEAGGPTTAVLGCGPDQVYPPEHKGLLERILTSGGGILTEYPPKTPPLPHHFPRRNRLLVGLCQALLVVESRIKSGTMTSVRWAADLGVEVLALPGPADSLLAEGPITLLREGAIPVASTEHILEAIGLGECGVALSSRARDRSSLSRAEGRLLALLGAEALDLDALVAGSGESPGSVLSLLMSLELNGHIERESNGFAWRALRD